MVTTSVSVVPVVPFRWFRWFRWFRSGGYARYAGSGGSVPVVSFRCSGFYHMLTESMIRDRLVFGASDTRIKERLL